MLRDYFLAEEDSDAGAAEEDAEAASDPAGVYEELLDVLPDGLVALEYAEAQDKDAVVVSAETAEEYDLTEIGDLADVAGDLTLGGAPEWKTRQTGLPGLEDVYGVVFGDFIELDAGGPQSLSALLNDRVDAANLFTTDPNIAAEDLVPLEDPDALFAAQNVVPLLRERRRRRHRDRDPQQRLRGPRHRDPRRAGHPGRHRQGGPAGRRRAVPRRQRPR